MPRGREKIGWWSEDGAHASDRLLREVEAMHDSFKVGERKEIPLPKSSWDADHFSPQVSHIRHSKQTRVSAGGVDFSIKCCYNHPMINEKLIYFSDHDGTLTDADQEALHYDDIALSYLVKTLDIREEELAELMLEAKNKIKSEPSIYGWKRNGFIVAPASADHYIFNTVATEMVLEHLRSNAQIKLTTVPTPDEQGAFMNNFFSNYKCRVGKSREFLQRGCQSIYRSSVGCW